MLRSKFRNLRLVHDTQGLTTVEYVIVLALIAVVSVGAWQKFGKNVHDYIDQDTKKISNEMNK